jgi:glycosyltransferase involved in cell wall biosynthesis
MEDVDFEFLFVDDGSTDGTVSLIRGYAEQYPRQVKAILNATNFGYVRNLFYALQQAEGNCAFLLHADLQNPPELIPEFVRRWEAGCPVVIGIKNKSRENPVLYFIRSLYYKLMKRIADVPHLKHFTEFELLDRSFLDVLRNIKDPYPYLRGIIAEYSGQIEIIRYTQDKRKKGKSSFGFWKYYDFAMLGITSYTSRPIRWIMLLGVFLLLGSGAGLACSLLYQACYLKAVRFGALELAFVMGLLSALQTLCLGLVGEYVLFSNRRNMARPIVVERERLNFDGHGGQGHA